MARFTDVNGVEHELKITYPAAKRLRAAGVDLLKCLAEPAETQNVLAAVADPETLVACVVELLQVPAAEVPAFLELFDGDVFERAGVALLEAITDFFPQRQRQILQELQKSLTAWRETAGAAVQDLAVQQIRNLDWASVVSASAARSNGSTESAEPPASIRSV